MKNFYVNVLLVVSLYSFSLSAQVGINTISPNGALDIDSTTDGILVPRVALSATNVATVVTPTVSELVYNTFTGPVGANQVTPGFYYWNGSLWLRVATTDATSNNWALNGNTGSNPTTDYIGTSDAADLVIRTNGTGRIQIAANGNVGVSETVPNSKLDIVQTETTGNSLEISHNNATNGSSAAWIANNGTNRGLHVQNLSPTSNSNVARFLQLGDGPAANGVLVEMNNTTVAAGMVLDHSGSGDGLQILQSGSGDGFYNDVTSGLGQLNVIRSNSIGIASVLDTAGGTGEFIDFDVQNGTGVYVIGADNPTTPTAGGDVYSFFSSVRTATPTSAGTVYGAILAGNQYGVGHGILINHSGSQGRNAEFNITNSANPDAAITAFHSGQGSAILAQNRNNALAGTIAVGDFAYVGTDVDDHIGVRGASTPSAGFGIGVFGEGGWYGVVSLGNLQAVGDLTATGTKPFTIDHPADPSNKMLKHFAIESNEVLNMYRGVVQLDGNGLATVQLPDYFSLINKDYSYQLTAIGTSKNPYVKQEITENTFIVGGAPNTKVSWTVYADRNDPYMQTYPERGVDVVQKEGERNGKYFSPELYNQPESKGMFYHEKSNSTPTSKIQLPEGTSKHIEKVNNIEKKTPTRPKNNADNEEKYSVGKQN